MAAPTCQQVAGDVELLGHAYERLVGIGEESFDRRREERMIADLDPAVQNPPSGCARGGDGSPAVQKVVAEVRDPRSNATRRPRVDGILELLDLGVGGVQ